MTQCVFNGLFALCQNFILTLQWAKLEPRHLFPSPGANAPGTIYERLQLWTGRLNAGCSTFSLQPSAFTHTCLQVRPINIAQVVPIQIKMTIQIDIISDLKISSMEQL